MASKALVGERQWSFRGASSSAAVSPPVSPTASSSAMLVKVDRTSLQQCPTSRYHHTFSASCRHTCMDAGCSGRSLLHLLLTVYVPLALLRMSSLHARLSGSLCMTERPAHRSDGSSSAMPSSSAPAARSSPPAPMMGTHAIRATTAPTPRSRIS